MAEQLLQINENGKFTLIKDRPEGWLPKQEILDKILRDALKKETKQDPQVVVDPRNFEKPDEQFWAPPPDQYNTMLYESGLLTKDLLDEAWKASEKEIDEELHPERKTENTKEKKKERPRPYDWRSPAERFVPNGPEKDRLRDRLNKAWTSELEESRRFHGWPAGWLPDEKKVLKPYLDAEWKKEAEAKLDEDLFQTARMYDVLPHFARPR